VKKSDATCVRWIIERSNDVTEEIELSKSIMKISHRYAQTKQPSVESASRKLAVSSRINTSNYAPRTADSRTNRCRENGARKRAARRHRAIVCKIDDKPRSKTRTSRSAASSEIARVFILLFHRIFYIFFPARRKWIEKI
jgi:hypothetical protein